MNNTQTTLSRPAFLLPIFDITAITTNDLLVWMQVNASWLETIHFFCYEIWKRIVNEKHLLRIITLNNYCAFDLLNRVSHIYLFGKIAGLLVTRDRRMCVNKCFGEVVKLLDKHSRPDLDSDTPDSSLLDKVENWDLMCSLWRFLNQSKYIYIAKELTNEVFGSKSGIIKQLNIALK
jgi:hypothetical protein